ncbi:hypothetical protein M569_11121, partial [Genlisea aurea]
AVVYLQDIWPFSSFKFNDLRASDKIVSKLPIPESTRNFVYAIRDPESKAVIFILCVQNLSERSASDADCLIKAVKPDAVVVQVGNLNSIESNRFFEPEDSVPTSVFEVLKKCFMLKINREKFENAAGNLVLREIFGVSFNEHIFAAKKAASEVGSSFLMLESPSLKSTISENVDEEEEEAAAAAIPDSGPGLGGMLSLQFNSLVPPRVQTSVPEYYHRAFRIDDAVRNQMMRSLSSYMASANPDSNRRPAVDYQIPEYAKGVYPLLVDLHDMFSDIPSIGNALASAQRMLSHVDRGEAVDNHLLSEVYAFQIAVEGLRIGLTNAGRMIRTRDSAAPPEFSDLPVEEKSQAILARGIRSQTEHYKSVVAVVDASVLSGLRKHWKTIIPPGVKVMVDQLVVSSSDDTQNPKLPTGKRLIAEKPVVAVGAGATAIYGASYISKIVPVSPYIKFATLQIPSSLQKAFVYAYYKLLSPAKFIFPGMTKGGSAAKTAVSAQKIRAVAHGVITSAEKTSLSAMRTAFYQIMRRRRRTVTGTAAPWIAFGCSIATCGGLIAYGDGIECAAESVPSAGSIANLGRGIRSLHEASMIARPAESSRIQKSIESVLYKFNNLKI